MKLKKTALCMAVVAILAVGVLLPQSTATVSANSAQRYFHGADAFGAAYKGDSCPFVVEKENLTFNLSDFPSNYYDDKDSFLAYSGSVTAEYTFYNPSEYTVTANLAFPFGETPAYGYYYEDGKRICGVDAEKYDILVGGEKVDKKVRYTYFKGGDFSVETDLPKISDEYVKDDFFSPETVVTEYSYIVGGKNKDGLIDESKYNAACIAFDIAKSDGKTLIMFPRQSGFKTLKNGKARIDAWAENGGEFKIYAFGKPLDTPISFKCYKNGGVEDKEEISGKVELTDTVTTNLKDLIKSVRGEKSEISIISEIDLYNASVYSLKDGSKDNEYGIIFSYGSIFSSDFETSLMRWYEYEITLEPNERKTNSVTAPIYPSIDMGYSPAKNAYTYYLSPAKTWKSFGSIDITINTPYYLSNPSLSGFKKTDGGYTLSLSGLPDGELTFTLSSSENPTRVKSGSGFAVVLTILLSVLFIVIPVVLLAVIIIVVIIKNRKNAKSE